MSRWTFYFAGRGQTAKVTADSAISGLAFDPVDANLYWIDQRRASILVQSLRTLAKRTVMDNLTSPTAIEFLDDRRQLIVVDGLRLLTARPDGSAVSVLVDRLSGSVSSLAYSRTEPAIYIGHPARRIITRVGLDRQQRGETSATFLSGIGEVADLAVNEDLLYWTEKGAAELFWIKMDRLEPGVSDSFCRDLSP